MSPFDTLVGQERAVARLEAALDAPVPAYLFVGPPGSGKREAARRFAGELFARGAERTDPDAPARHRRLAAIEQHPDLVVIERTGPSITIEEAREVVRAASTSPSEAAVKVLLLVDFHLVAERAPTVLKAIEEPPPTTMFVILAEDVPPELVTIASRCVRIDFAPVPEAEVVERLVADGVDPAVAEAAARGAGGDLGRARLLATDPQVVARLAAWREVPMRLDGTGHVATTVVDELLALIDDAAEPLRIRHQAELTALEERVERFGERGSGRKDLLDRHRRELRRHRTDELRTGLTAMARVYRELLAAGEHVEPLQMVRAGEVVHETVASLARNPTERLALQAVMVRLPVLH